MKTDNLAEVGLHVFQKAGLGLAPFRFVDIYTAPGQGDGCHYCGTGIKQVCVIESADGKRFKVGIDCVRKTNSAGLIKAYTMHPKVRELNRQKRHTADLGVKAAWEAILNDAESVGKLKAIIVSKWDGSKETWFDFALRAWGYCGMAGRKRYLKVAKRLIETGSL